MKEKTERRKKIELLTGISLITIAIIASIAVTNVYFGVPLSTILISMARLSGICIAVPLTVFISEYSIYFAIRIIKKRLKGITDLILYVEREPYKETLKDLLMTFLLAAILTLIIIALAKINDEVAAYVSVFMYFFILFPLLFVALPLTIMQLVAGFMSKLFRYEGSLLHQELRKEKRRTKELETHKTLEDK